LGIYDLSGNVDEWCWDLFGGSADYYPGGSLGDYNGAETGIYRVFSGGDYLDHVLNLEISMRGYALDPSQQAMY